jgi:hypothetical protein
MSKSTPRRASDAVDRLVYAARHLPIPQEFKDDMALAQYILLEVFHHTRPNSNTPAHAEALQDFINHMKKLAQENER